MELPLLQVIVSSCLAAECTSCAEREVMFISFFTSPADFLHSEYVYFQSSSFFTVGLRLLGNELTPSENTRLWICSLCQAVSLCHSHSSSMQACGQKVRRRKTNITFSCCHFIFLNWVF